MPRQPYLPTFAHLNYAVGALVLKNRPDLCAAIGKCIAIWGQVDNEMGNLFSLLLGTESDAALEVFLSLRRFSNQRDALSAAAKHRLQGEELHVFEAILGVYKSLEDERNKLAHGCFGISDDDPDVLFWIEVKNHVHFQTDVLSVEARGVVSEDRHSRLKQNLYVYRRADLDALYSQMEEFWWTAFHLNGYLRDPRHPGRVEEFRQLCTSPQISRKIAELTSKSACA